MEAQHSSETSDLTRATRHNIPEDGILHSHRENLKSYIALTGWALWRRRNVSPVRYELGSYIPEDGNLQSHRRENLKSYRLNETSATRKRPLRIPQISHDRPEYVLRVINAMLNFLL
jgi:hypothetical protein